MVKFWLRENDQQKDFRWNGKRITSERQKKKKEKAVPIRA